jgi:hypothetical protein
MMSAAEAVEAMDYALGYELMRALLRAELEHVASPAELAAHLGVSERDLSEFLAGGEPGADLWAAGEALSGKREPVTVTAEALALNMMADTFPIPERPTARRALADAVRPVLAAAGRGPVQ